MNQEEKTVISASRRTDIPAFYMDWFMAQVKRGYFEVLNPFSHKVSTVSARPDDVHTVVFWSKDFGPFIKGHHGEALERIGYHLFFNFTINSEAPLLEPNLPALGDRLRQLEYLCERFTPESIQWRFDPLCFYRTDDGPEQNNLEDFQQIADRTGTLGVKRCVTSFMDHYRKIQKRTSRIPGFFFHDPPLDRKLEIILEMEKTLSRREISLFTCCEKEIIDILPEASRIRQSACIPNDLLMELYGGTVSLKDDPSQRLSKGCGCKMSKDIGSYRLHPCFHDCLFCYANPASPSDLVTAKTDLTTVHHPK